jgi:hypothetical protein
LLDEPVTWKTGNSWGFQLQAPNNNYNWRVAENCWDQTEENWDYKALPKAWEGKRWRRAEAAGAKGCNKPRLQKSCTSSPLEEFLKPTTSY